MPNDFQNQIQKLQQALKDLNDEVYRNNFSSSQDFPKYSRFNSRMKLPTLAAAPATCEIGEVHVLSTNGKLYVCSAANVWTAQT